MPTDNQSTEDQIVELLVEEVHGLKAEHALDLMAYTRTIAVLKKSCLKQTDEIVKLKGRLSRYEERHDDVQSSLYEMRENYRRTLMDLNRAVRDGGRVFRLPSRVRGIVRRGMRDIS